MTLELVHVSLFASGQPLVMDVALQLERGVNNVLLGPTLSGKTTRMRPMAGPDAPAQVLLLGGGVMTLWYGRVTETGQAPSVYRRPDRLDAARIYRNPPLNKFVLETRGAHLSTSAGHDLVTAAVAAALTAGRYTCVFCARNREIRTLCSDRSRAIPMGLTRNSHRIRYMGAKILRDSRDRHGCSGTHRKTSAART